MRLTAISAMILAILMSLASAQERAAPSQPARKSATETSAPQAPVGHRQPRPSDLPPDVLRREEGREPPRSSEQPGSAQRSGIDPELRICRPC